MNERVDSIGLDSPIASNINDYAEIRDILHESNVLKEEGNNCFRQSQWRDALEHYQLSLQKLSRTIIADEPLEGSKPRSDVGELSRARAILHGNIGACFSKLNDYAEAVKSCTEALKDNPDYIKVLKRRAECNERIGNWTSLTQVQADLNHLLDLLPSDDRTRFEISRKLKEIEPKMATAQKTETDEMLAKLKVLGDNILGNFGLSTNNFKLQPNGEGGYSMQFQQ